jgi:EAL domain-containing protein (putative c-di-GMP-specific phosphodiesterase class I)
MFNFAKDSFKNAVNGKVHFGRVCIAFQPIVDAGSSRIWGYEALTRGAEGQSYPALIAGMDENRRKSFDKLTTAKALREAGRLGLLKHGAKLTLNVRPSVDLSAVDAAFVARAARHYGIAMSSLVLELTEDATLSCDDFKKVMELHRSVGIATGIDDFGSGYSGLNVLATCGADMVKLDQHLVRGIDTDAKKQIIVEAFTQLCGKLGSLVVAEGVETKEEAETLRDQGVELMQGYYFGRPVVGAQPVLPHGITEVGTKRRWGSSPMKSWGETVRMRA